MRSELAKATSDFNTGSSPLAALDNLEKAVESEEASAEAWEELVQVDEPGKLLEEKYGSGSVSVDMELQKLMGSGSDTKLLE